MIHPLDRILPAATVVLALTAGTALTMPMARADGDNNTLVPNNKRLNDGVLANIYTAQRQAGCTHDVNSNPQLQLAARRHADDLMNNRALDGELGSDGSSPQDRANAAGYQGKVAETVAINPALAINGVEIVNQWYGNPVYKTTMSDCAYSQVGVWSENSLDRSVLVAVYGQPPKAPPAVDLASGPSAIDPSPDYDASDELEFGTNWFAWILRGVYPPPAYPPQ
ncbi:CAP domain-containing protein [Mycobacterium colombiense]